MNGNHFQDEYDNVDDDDLIDDEDEYERIQQRRAAAHNTNTNTNNPNEAAAVAVNIQLEAQKQVYIRFAQFILAMTGFFFLILFSNGNPFLLLLAVIFGGYLLYVLGSLLMSIFLQNQLLQPGILTEADTTLSMQMQQQEQDEQDEHEQQWQSYTFAETPRQIQKCPSKIGCTHPTNGLYKIVYSAIYFGKTIRTEAQLDLKFSVARQGNGWHIHGTSLSGKHSSEGNRIVSEGFVNARGEMYWKLSNPDETIHAPMEQEGMVCTYRGLLDFDSNTMFDGEFEAERVPRGRIVRLELIMADPSSSNTPNGSSGGGGNAAMDSWGDADAVEMVEMGKGWD